MGRFEYSGIDELLNRQQSAADDLSELTDDLIDSAGKIMKHNVETAIYRAGHVRTGQLLNSIKIKKKVYKNKDGGQPDKGVFVSPVGVDTNGVSNGEKAFVNNYGRSNKPGTRYWDKADAESEKEIKEAEEMAATLYYKQKGLI